MIKNNSIKKLPKEIDLVWGALYGASVNSAIAKKYDLKIDQIAALTILINDLFFKNKDVKDVEGLVEKEIVLKGDELKELTKEILGKRLLIVDNEWFDGQVSIKINELGGDIEEYGEDIKLYKDEVEKEDLVDKEESLRTGDLKRDSMDRASEALKDPEAEKKSAKIVFEKYIVPMLKVNDYELKIELNARLITLLFHDKPKKFQESLLKTLYANKELITKEKIITKEEKKEPSVGNWILDYIHYVGIDEAISTLKKTQYFMNSKNVKKLNPEDKKLIDSLLDLFVDVKNFYDNIEKYELEDIHIFPFSSDEIQSFTVVMQENLGKLQESSKFDEVTGEIVENKIDKPFEIYSGGVEEKLQIAQEKQALIEATRKEYNKIADILEDHLLHRRKIKILACLELLAETGALDIVVGKDPRYVEFMNKYFKRNHLDNEIEEFKKNAYQAKYVQHFLKFIFLERLGMTISEGAKYAVLFSNIFREIGSTQYAQLAYLDMQDEKFKWNE